MDPLHADRRALVELIDETAHQLRRHELISGSAFVELGAVGWLLFAVTLDMLFAMPVAMRVLVWAAFWIILLSALGYGVVWPTFRRRKAEEVALRIERAIGGMHNRLLTVLALDAANGQSRENPAFVARLIEQTRAKTADYRVEQVANPARMRRMVTGAGATVVLIVLMAALFSDRMPTALARIMMPTANLPPVTWLRIEAAGDLEVLQGEPVKIGAMITRGEAASLTLHLKPKGEAWVQYPMGSDSATDFSFTLSAATGDYEYFVSGGKTWTPTYRIHAAPRPIVEDVKYAVLLPDYMKLPEPRIVSADAPRIEAPIGSTLRLSAKVGGEPVRGEMGLFEPKQVTTRKTIEQETVWFEDELPADAVTHGDWRWSTVRAFSGVKSFTFGWNREPFAFKTRLYPMSAAPESTLFVYVWLDPQSPPQRLIVSYLDNGNIDAVVWGAKLANASRERTRFVYAGPLPEGGQWTRLVVPLSMMIGDRSRQGVKLDGMSFEIDSGRAFIDRPGFFTSRGEDVQTTELLRLGQRSMDLDGKSGEWTGAMTIERDVQVGVTFYNKLDHASRTRKPMAIVAAKDEPPTVTVERPGRDVMLAEPAALPITARAFDDYGVGRVGIQLGVSENELHSVRWIETYDEPATMRLATTSIDPEAELLKPGASLFYRVVVEDRKGQSVSSAVYRLSIAAAPTASEADKGAPPLDGLLKGLGELVSMPIKAVDAAASGLFKDLPDHLKSADIKRDGFKHADGTPMSDEEIAALFKGIYNGLTDAQRQQLAQLNAQLDDQEKQIDDLAKQLAATSDQAKNSPLSAPGEDAALANMAQDAQAMAQQLDAKAVSEGEAAQLERLARTEPLTPAQRDKLAAMQTQLQQMQAARGNLAKDPAAAQAQMKQVMAQQAARSASDQIADLQKQLQMRQHLLEQWKAQQQELAQQTENAPASKLDEISKTQKDLDEKAAELMAKNQQLLSDRPRKADELPEAPWAPPGRVEKVAPVEKDTPDPNKVKESAGGDQQAQAAKDEQKMKDSDWWDKPIEATQENRRTELDERFAGRDRPVERLPAKEGAAGQAEQTPRQRLREHQERARQELTENSEQLRGAMGQTDAAQQQLGPAMAAAQQQSRGESTGPSQQTGEAAAKSTAQLQAALNSPDVQSALAMAQRAAGQAAMTGSARGSATGPTNSTTPPGGRSFGSRGYTGKPGEIDESGVEAVGVDGAKRAALYRLPPRVREPLIQGMNEHGPEGYQPLIDAYYRQLTREAETQP
ncbi:MAG: hypothetical protein GC162_03595 [Planctomycetes bacterium]|nr:hypothetical protein [Planctomycetota bacterium]